jgi:hypothetical protein
MNPGLRKCEAEMLTTRPRRTVRTIVYDKTTAFFIESINFLNRRMLGNGLSSKYDKYEEVFWEVAPCSKF